MGGIATLTLNAALDRTLHVDRIEAGGKSRLRGESAQAGGKGVNVARVLHALGAETRALVVVGGATGRAIADDLARSGLPAQCVEAPGESRICLEILEPNGRATQLHGSGVHGAGGLLDEIARVVGELPAPFEWLAICGSLPPGMPSDAVGSLLLAARRRGLRVAVDTSGDALATAWRQGPDLVRINDAELAAVLPTGSRELPPYASLGPATRGVVSRGALPFDAWSGEARLRVVPPRVEVVNAIGCGDAMMAGLLASLAADEAFESALRKATALASAEARSPLAGRTDLALARSLEPGVEIAASSAR
jgi:tagatose 6-phosphate kinase